MNKVRGARRRVAVTGAAAGIGHAIAHRFAASGYAVALIDRDGAVLDTARDLGTGHRGFVCDISQEHEVLEVAHQIAQNFGEVDVLVNNAGIGAGGPAVDLSTQDWDTVIATNLRGAFLCTRTFGRGMITRGWGRIISIASQNATAGLPNHLAYSTAKAGLLGMTRVLAVEWGPRGVTANSVSPTYIDTQMTRASWTTEMKDALLQTIPIGRIATRGDVASAVAFLATEEAGMINGQNLQIDGGSSVTT